MASLGIARANDAWRTAGKLWMALEPMGHARRCCHRGFDARRLLARESAEYEIVRRPATSTVVGVREATFCGCWRRSAEGACLAELAKREDSCLNIIVLPSASDGGYAGGCRVRDADGLFYVPRMLCCTWSKLVRQKSGSGPLSVMSVVTCHQSGFRLDFRQSASSRPASLRVHAN
jgi:hypothetical protein